MTFRQFSLFDPSGAATAEATAPVNPVPAWIAPRMGDDGEAFGLPLSAWVEFDAWLHTPEGGEIANRFLRLAVRMHRRGWDHYSAQGVIEQMRWEHDLAHGPDVGGFKINHNWRRRMTLWAMVRCPELDGFFRVREHEQEDAKNHAQGGGNGRHAPTAVPGFRAG